MPMPLIIKHSKTEVKYDRNVDQNEKRVFTVLEHNKKFPSTRYLVWHLREQINYDISVLILIHVNLK